MKLTLDHMRTLDAQFGYPSRNFASVHIAGTNGKGSVATKMAACLQRAGHRVGLFTSPHIKDYRERIRINGEMIDSHFAEAALAELSPDCNFFEAFTLLAMRYFSTMQVDIAIFETGLGGEFDATNILQPKLCVITSISLDHTKELGNTIEQIARAKAGIIKRGVPVVVGPHVKPLYIFEEAAEKLFVVRGTFPTYDLENQAIARKALEKLGLPYDAQGLSALPSCRLERVGNAILDGAHNPDAIDRLFATLSHLHPNKKFHVIAAFSKRKKIQACIERLSFHAHTLCLCTIEHEWGAALPNAPTLQEALEQKREEGDLLVITGTLYMMEETRRRLGADDLSEKVR